MSPEYRKPSSDAISQGERVRKALIVSLRVLVVIFILQIGVTVVGLSRKLETIPKCVQWVYLSGGTQQGLASRIT